MIEISRETNCESTNGGNHIKMNMNGFATFHISFVEARRIRDELDRILTRLDA